MRKLTVPLLLFSSHSLLAAHLATADFIQTAHHKHQLRSNLSPTITLTRQVAWSLAGNPHLYAKVSGMTFYNHTDINTGQCTGAGRRLDLSQNAFVDTGIAINGAAGDLAPITLNTSAFISSARVLGYTLPRSQGCVKVSMSYQAGPTRFIPNQIKTDLGTHAFEYGNIVSSGGNIISDGRAVNNHADLLQAGVLQLNRPAHAQCWGRNSEGQLGNGTLRNTNFPINVANELGEGVVKISSGRNHACALLKTGSVKCWGQNQYGQLGNATLVDSNTPVQVSGLTKGVIDIATGRESACALLNTGGVKCWGQNQFWQLGDGTRTNRLVPTDVSGLTSGVKSIAAGYIHTCALLNSGQIKCWGEGLDGQLGDGTIESRRTPVFVSHIGGESPKATAVATGPNFTCAIINKGGFFANGAAECWGSNSVGQLGDNTFTKRLIPTQVQGLTKGVTAISLGLNHTCAIVNGGMKCWGSNVQGQLGIGKNPVNLPTPQSVIGFSTGVKSIIANYFHTCAFGTGTDGMAKCWGLNTFGQLGNINLPAGQNSATPTAISPLVPGSVNSLGDGNNSNFSCLTNNPANVDTTLLDNNATSIALNNIGTGIKNFNVADLSARGIKTKCSTSLNPNAQCDFSYDGSSSRGYGAIAVTDSTNKVNILPFRIQHVGHVSCWGSNNFGQLGTGSIDRKLTTPHPVLLPNNREAKQIVTGSHHTCILLEDGNVACSGDNTFGQLGDDNGGTSNSPVVIKGFTGRPNVVSLAAGADHTCALLMNGEVDCWGKNNLGQLGDGSTTNSSRPTKVHNLPASVTAITVGSDHSCALLKSGQSMCWGRNNTGQLGDSTTTNRTQAVAVSNLTDSEHRVVAINAGKQDSCALLSDGSVKCWGKNSFAQLGLGFTSTFEAIPHQVVGLTSGVAAISVGGIHACTLMQDGSERCWGSNSNGQIGIGSTDAVITTPHTITALGNDVTAISTGQAHNCAMLSDGSIKCWGRNPDGQLGNGTFNQSNVPVPVTELNSAFDLAQSSGDSSFNCAIH